MNPSFRTVRNNGFLIFIILLALVPAICGCSRHSGISDNITYELNLNNKKAHVEVVFTQNDRKMGLMFRDMLDKDHGMLFVFPKEQNLSFWMKNTKIPLSIAFINSSMIITQIESMVPYSLESHESEDKVRFALEMEEGWFRKNSITVGSKVGFPPDLQNINAE